MKKHIKSQQCDKKSHIENRFLIIVLVLCSMLGVTHVTAQKSPNPTLYKVVKATENHFGSPYRTTINGDIIGEAPNMQIYEVIAIEGGWAKIKYKGGEYYIWKDNLEKVDKPDFVCSPWAKDWLSYTGEYIGTAGEWNGMANDLTKPVTRAEMAKLLVGIMRNIYGDWCVWQTLPGAIKTGGKDFFTDTQDFDAGRLAYWGIVPKGKFNPAGNISYNEVIALVIKLMAYDKKYIREGGGIEFTKADIAKFAIGGNKGPNAKCTKEQVKILCDKVICWRQEMALLIGAKYEEGGMYDGTVNVYNGTYTIKTLLGTKPNQPHLFVNDEGKVELNSAKKQQFKITYKKNLLSKDRNVMFLYTIQTMDGKYLGISGTPMNGSRLIAQKAEYLWWIEQGSSEDGQYTNFIEDPSNYHQVLNVSDWKIDNGTPIITWFWRHGTGSDSNNCKFILSKVK